MRMGCIYLLSCLDTRKHYIGQTTADNPSRRWNAHLRDAAKGSDLLLHRAMRKHVGRFAVDVVWYGPADELDARETEFIALAGTLAPKGYNMIAGGKGVQHSPATARKISRKAKTRMADPAVRAAMSQRSKELYASPKGDEVRAKISVALTGRLLSNKVRKAHSDGLHKRYAKPSEHQRTAEAARRHYDSPAGAETRRKQSEAAQRRILSGPYHSEATRLKISEAAKAQHAHQKTAGMTHAGKAYR